MHCKLFFSRISPILAILFYFIFPKITEKKLVQFLKKILWNKLAKMPKYSPQQKTLLGTHSSEISLTEWNFVHIWGPIPGSILVAGPNARSGSHLKGFAIMVQFRFWWGHFRTTEWSVDGGFCTTEWSVDGGFCQVIMLWAWLLGVYNWQNPCSKTHSSVLKARNAPGILKT
jgi:hypothetical protein